MKDAAPARLVSHRRGRATPRSFGVRRRDDRRRHRDRRRYLQNAVDGGWRYRLGRMDADRVVLGSVPTLIGALCYAELASTFPNAGGDYHSDARVWTRRQLLLRGRALRLTTGSIATGFCVRRLHEPGGFARPNSSGFMLPSPSLC